MVWGTSRERSGQAPRTRDPRVRVLQKGTTWSKGDPEGRDLGRGAAGDALRPRLGLAWPG